MRDGSGPVGMTTVEMERRISIFCWIIPTGLVMGGCEDEERTLPEGLNYPPMKELMAKSEMSTDLPEAEGM